jgi:hypothetical protein
MTRIGLLAVACSVAITAQSPDGARERGIHSQVFRDAREAAAETPPTAAKGATKAAPKATPSKAKSKQTPAAGTGAMLGVNLWRMRPGTASSALRIRGLKHRADPQGTGTWTVEHADFEQSFKEGEYVRLSLEAAGTGYLYVIDRDVYADGTKSAPTMIFPTGAIRGGKNLVQPGKPLEIPSLDDQPPVFEVVKTRPDQKAIELVMILSPQPLQGVTPGKEELKLPESQVAEWERMWGQQVQRSEDRSLVGKLYSAKERDAAQDAGKSLEAADPLPLTIFSGPARTLLAKATIQIGGQ